MSILPELDETMRLAFVDLDGVLVENSERELQATMFVRDCLNFPVGEGWNTLPLSQAWDEIFYSRIALYNPDFIKLDKLQEGAIDGLDFLTQRNYFTFLLTSRPDTPKLRKATETWLEEHHFTLDIPLSVPGHDTLIMKPSAVSDNRITTKAWKASVIQMFAAIYEADEIIVIDDDSRNLEEIKKHAIHGECRVFASFQEMREALGDEH